MIVIWLRLFLVEVVRNGSEKGWRKKSKMPFKFLICNNYVNAICNIEMRSIWEEAGNQWVALDKLSYICLMEWPRRKLYISVCLRRKIWVWDKNWESWYRDAFNSTGLDSVIYRYNVGREGKKGEVKPNT